MNSFFAYGYEVPVKGKRYFVERIEETKGERNKKTVERKFTSEVQKIKKIEIDLYIIYTYNSRYVVQLLR